MARQQFAIRRIKPYFIDTPGPPRRVEENIKVGECSLDVDDLDVDTSGSLVEKTYIGYGLVLVQVMPGQVVPQEISFDIDAETIHEAFEKFEESLEIRIRELEKQNQSVKPPTPDELMALSGDNNGIIMP